MPTPTPKTLLAGGGVGEPHRLPDVVREEQDEHQREVQEVAMDVLQDQRETNARPVALARLADRAGRRVGPERLVVGAAVVVAGEPEQPRRPEDQQRRRERQPAGPPAGLRTHQACGDSPKISGE